MSDKELLKHLMVRIHPECPNQDPICSPSKKGDVGFDLRAWVEDGKEMTLLPQRMVNVRTGVYVKIPEGYWGDIRSRSSTFMKRSLFVMHATIDEGYTGELSTVIWNPLSDICVIKNGDRLAQLVLIPRFTPPIDVVESLPDTERGLDGFGSTGI